MNAEHETLRKLATGATPGPWKAVSAPHFDSGLVYTSVQPVTVDEDVMKPMAMANGEYHVCRMSHTAAEWRFNYHRANAAYIAAASPDVILALLDRVEALEKALEPFSDMAGELFARNCNRGDIVLALDGRDNPDEPHHLTAGDFFDTRSALRSGASS